MSRPLFWAAVQFGLPEYDLRTPDGGLLTFAHPSGVTVQLGRTPSGLPSCLTESDQHDEVALELLRGERNGLLETARLPDLSEFCRGLRTVHRQAANDVVGALRWITRRDEGGPAVLALQHVSWSEDRSNWHPMRIDDPPLLDIGWGTFDVDASWRTYIGETIATGKGEPSAHEMLQEAWGLLDSSPRSCLVMVVAAFEVGVKQHVRRMGGTYVEGPVGDTAMKLLNKDVRALRPDRWKKPPAWLNVRLEGGVTARNKLVHDGGPPLPREDLRKLLRGVRDVLYLLDWQQGHDWALTYVSYLHGDLDLVGPDALARAVLRRD